MPAPQPLDPHHTVAAAVTRAARVLGLGIAGAVLLALGLGVWRAATSPAAGKGALVDGLLLAQVILTAALILLGSMVEGFGHGLSLGTRWPYTRNILALLLRGDAEAAHRLLATAVGLAALALALLQPGYLTYLGLGLILATALLGMGTLYVLAGRAPALVHGVHGLLAYLLFLNYLVGLSQPGVHLAPYLDHTFALHAVLFAILLGGMVTGQRGFGKPLQEFLVPTRGAQWMFVAHGFAALLVLGTLGWLAPVYPVAFGLALVQAAVGFFVFHAVNLKPKSPGAIVAFHQAMALLLTAAIVLGWQ
ncbi:MAG TPA: hypothetical protein VMV31_01565 [Terriglobales bacterium]|nr:hypothetical protein [Terriglobales bacterium]